MTLVDNFLSIATSRPLIFCESSNLTFLTMASSLIPYTNASVSLIVPSAKYVTILTLSFTLISAGTLLGSIAMAMITLSLGSTSFSLTTSTIEPLGTGTLAGRLYIASLPTISIPFS